MYELKDYLNAVNSTKERLMDTEDETWEKKYPPFVVNKCVAPFQDTIMLVNEINQFHHLDKKLQFDFLINSLRPRKRYTPWRKAVISYTSKAGITLCISKSYLLWMEREPTYQQTICLAGTQSQICYRIGG